MRAPRGRTALLLALALAGCTGSPPVSEPLASQLERRDALGDCARLLGGLDRLVAARGTADAEAARVPGHPYLRVDRLLDHLRARAAGGPAAYRAWLDRLVALDRRARAAELQHAGAGMALPAVERCRGVLRAAAERDPGQRAQLLEQARVPPSYRASHRLLGLYPLTSIPFSWGVAALHRSIARTYATPLAELPVRGRLHRYVPSAPRAAGGTSEALASARRDPLGIPLVGARGLARALARFAPVWEVDTASEDDRPGALVWSDGRLTVDASRPLVYRRVAHTVFEDTVLVQLVYVLWFGARPPSGPLDLFAGHLDGLTWRVTLDRDGRPLVYDAMHNCGCYHMFFPTERLERRAAPGRPWPWWQEPIVIAQSLPSDLPGRLVLRVASRTHYIERVYPVPDRAGTAGAVPVSEYAAAPYDSLRAPPGPGPSAFGSAGLVPGSERSERWLFWPMGVPSAGAMRQWGRHAVAFVGVRHFDDADLIGRYFRRASAASSPHRAWPE